MTGNARTRTAAEGLGLGGGIGVADAVMIGRFDGLVRLVVVLDGRIAMITNRERVWNTIGPSNVMA